MKQRILLFLLLNFGALGIGGMFTGNGVVSDWYASLHKAPWTPPGWVFGAAWTIIMICFSFFMAFVTQPQEGRQLAIKLYSLQWMLNVAWNPLFFTFHWANTGLIVILLLTILIGWMLGLYYSKLKMKSILLLPYFIWLLIATSLNAYISIYN